MQDWFGGRQRRRPHPEVLIQYYQQLLPPFAHPNVSNVRHYFVINFFSGPALRDCFFFLFFLLFKKKKGSRLIIRLFWANCSKVPMTDLQIQYKVRGIGDESGPDLATHRPCWCLLRDRLRTAIICNKLRADGADNDSPGPRRSE
jgi:hypothetical protein